MYCTLVPSVIISVFVLTSAQVEADERTPVPSLEQRQQSKTLVHEVFEAEFRQADTAKKQAGLAKALHSNASSDNDANIRFVMLSEATRLSEESGAVALLIQSIDQTGREFEIDILTAKASGLWRLSQSARDNDTRGDVLVATEELTFESMDAERFEVAKKLFLFAKDIAGKVRSRETIKRIDALGKQVADRKIEYEKVQDALSTLERNRSDPDANLVAGKYFCFRKQDWSMGIPMLARAGDPALKTIALLEMEKERTTEQEFELAEGWWKWCESAVDYEKKLALRRAVRPYNIARTDLSGVRRILVEQRLSAIEKQLGAGTVNEPAVGALSPDGLQFSGNACVLLSTLRYTGTSPITIEAYVTPLEAGRGSRPILANIQNSGVGLCMQDGSWEFTFHDTTGYRLAVSDAPVKIGERVHVAGVYDGRTVRLYLNGKLQRRQATTSGKHKASPFPLMMGADPDQRGRPDRFLNGIVHQLRVSAVPRYIENFDPEEELQIDKGTAALYELNKDSGNALKDLSDHRHHGTIHNATWHVPSD